MNMYVHIGIIILLLFNSIYGYKSLNFTKVSLIDKTCLEHYNKYVEPVQNVKNNENNENTSFGDYLEYWWNLEESDEELISRICQHIYIKYPTRHIRKAMH
jgi:hypothetical protein